MPDNEDLDPPRADTADDSVAVAESLSMLASALERDRRAG